MREPARYVNHKGREIALNSGDIHISTGELANWRYSYEMMNGRPTGFTRECSEKPVGYVVVGYRTRNTLYDVTVVDTYFEEPGRLYVGNRFLECFFVASDKDRTHLGPAADYTMAIIPAVEPRWQLEREYMFYSHVSGGGMNFDYNFDYNFDDASLGTRLVENASVIPAPVVLTVFGPATDPRITIAGNVYECECEVETGGKLVIDGSLGRITLFDRWGNAENAFETRRGKQSLGSGSYTFEPMPQGTHSVSCPDSLNLQVGVRELRDEWEWYE